MARQSDHILKIDRDLKALEVQISDLEDERAFLLKMKAYWGGNGKVKPSKGITPKQGIKRTKTAGRGPTSISEYLLELLSEGEKSPTELVNRWAEYQKRPAKDVYASVSNALRRIRDTSKIDVRKDEVGTVWFLK